MATSVLKRPPIPREHGAWAVLYAPYAIACLSLRQFPIEAMLGLVLLSAVFISHEPFAKLLRSRTFGAHEGSLRNWRNWLLIYAVTALTALVILVLVHSRWLLIAMGVLVLVPFTIHLWLAGERQDRTLLGEALGIVGLTSTCLVAWYLIRGRFETESVLLWSLCFLYFMSGVFFVKMRVSRFHKRESFAWRRGQNLTYHALLVAGLCIAAALGGLSWLTAVTFLPIVARAVVHSFVPDKKLNLRRIGLLEVVYTVLFSVTLPFTVQALV